MREREGGKRGRKRIVRREESLINHHVSLSHAHSLTDTDTCTADREAFVYLSPHDEAASADAVCVRVCKGRE